MINITSLTILSASLRRSDAPGRGAENATKAISKRLSTHPRRPEEQAQRRRRLTKGPSKLREDRVDWPKSKR